MEEYFNQKKKKKETLAWHYKPEIEKTVHEKETYWLPD